MSHYWIAPRNGKLHLLCKGVDERGMPFERIWDSEVDPAWLQAVLTDFQLRALQSAAPEGKTSVS